MAHIKTARGLDIPVEGAPKGVVQTLSEKPKRIALDLSPFEGMRFRLHAKQGDVVKVGQPLAEDKLVEGRMFVSPASGVIAEIQRGLKRRITAIVIDIADREEERTLPQIDPNQASKDEIKKRLMEGGLFAHIRQRPFNLLADPSKTPRDIFVSAVDTNPFSVPSSMHIEGNEKEFQAGLDALSKLTDGKVHLVYPSSASFFAENVEKHTVEGPHPVGNHSVHIHEIAPIQSIEDIVWTATAKDVVMIGHILLNGKYQTERVISIAGPAILPEKAGYFKVRAGYPVERLISGRVPKETTRFISGSLLTGHQVDSEGFLGFYDTIFCAVQENRARELLHFFRLGLDKYTASRTYFSGMSKREKKYNFTTSQHGEERGFIISSPYDNVMPMQILTMQLVKSVIAEDYDLAEELGFLEVAEEDFALATFVCPSKIEMVDIMKTAMQSYAQEVY